MQSFEVPEAEQVWREGKDWQIRARLPLTGQVDDVEVDLELGIGRAQGRAVQVEQVAGARLVEMRVCRHGVFGRQ